MGVELGMGVGVGVGVRVGTNSCPGPQPESNRQNANTYIATAFLLVFMFLLRYYGRTDGYLKVSRKTYIVLYRSSPTRVSKNRISEDSMRG